MDTDPADAPSRPAVGAAVRRGARQGLVTQFLLQAGSIVATIVLARLLSPGAFGVVAIAQSILALAQIFTVGSFGLAIVTARDRLQERAATFFWLTTGFGVVGAGAIALLARPLAGLLGQPHAAKYLAVLGISLCFEMAAIVPQALLRRSLSFRQFYRSQLLGAGTYFAVQIVLATLGFGAWSVIIGQIAMGAVSCVSAVWFARWVPPRIFDFGLVRQDLPYTSSQTIGQVLVYVQKNCDYWAVSRFLGGPALGVYYVAYVLPNILRQRITWVAQVVLVPAFAQIHEERSDLRAAWRKVWTLQAGLGIPSLIGVVVLAEPIVLTFFGAKWSDAVPVIRVLGFAALLNLHMTTVGVVATARRVTQRFVYVAAARTMLTIVAVIVAGSAFSSLVAMATAVVLASAAAAVLQEFLLAMPLDIGVRTITGLTVKFTVPAAVMGGALLGVLLAVQDAPAWLQLVVCVPVGAIAYFAVGMLLFRSTFSGLVSSGRQMLAAR